MKYESLRLASQVVPVRKDERIRMLLEGIVDEVSNIKLKAQMMETLVKLAKEDREVMYVN